MALVPQQQQEEVSGRVEMLSLMNEEEKEEKKERRIDETSLQHWLQHENVSDYFATSLRTKKSTQVNRTKRNVPEAGIPKGQIVLTKISENRVIALADESFEESERAVLKDKSFACSVLPNHSNHLSSAVTLTFSDSDLWQIGKPIAFRYYSFRNCSRVKSSFRGFPFNCLVIACLAMVGVHALRSTILVIVPMEQTVRCMTWIIEPDLVARPCLGLNTFSLLFGFGLKLDGGDPGS
eukprot:3162493-Amphidinium_carterae.1